MKRIEIIIAIVVLATASAFAGIGVVSIPLVETQVIPANDRRKWVLLQNNSTNDIYVKVDSSSTALTASNGVKIAANGGTFSVTANGTANPAQNAIKAISATGTNALVYQEGNEN